MAGPARDRTSELRFNKRATDHQTASAQPDAALLSRTYAFRKASRSALIVSACVVGMPCGKPL
jgi:hypothetical protein